MTDTLPIRVLVLATWDDVELSFPAATTVREAKEAALASARVSRDAAGFEVKFRGALVDDDRTLGEVGVVPNAQLIVLARRRLPVR